MLTYDFRAVDVMVRAWFNVAAPMIQAGAVIDGFELVRVLGEGPFGIVWLAKDVRRGTMAAIKLLRPHIISQSIGRTTFQRLVSSIKLYAELQHSGVCAVLRTVQQPQDAAYGLAMEYVEGQSLDRVQISLLTDPSAKVVDVRRLSRLLEWFEQIGAVVSWLHARAVVHGNLKPSNVMLLSGSSSGQLKLLDLAWSAIGIAKPAQGTVSFLSPEQLEGASGAAASDQWAIASILGRLLEKGAHPLPLTPASGVPSLIPQILERALSRAPAQRFSQMTDFVGAIRHARQALIEGPTDRQHPAYGHKPPPIASPAGIPSPEAFQEEPATVKVSISTVGAEPATAEILDPTAPLKAQRAPAARSLSGEIDMMESESFVAGDFIASVSSEPALVLDSLTLTPQAIRSPIGVKETKPARSISPLTLWGTGLLLIAGVIVFGALKWVRTAETSEVPHGVPALAGGDPTRTNGPAAANSMAADSAAADSTPPDSAAANSAAANSTAAAPKLAQPVRVASAEVEGTGGPTRMPEAATDTTKKPERSGGGSGSRSGRGLDAKADAAMARLAALPDEGENRSESRSRPELPATESEPRTVKTLDVSCDEGDGSACLRLGESLRGQTGPTSEAKARSAFERACAFARASGCIDAGELWVRTGGSEGGRKALALFERACTLKSADACHRAAEMWSLGKGGTIDESRASELEQQACAHGRKTSCRRARTSTSS